MLCQFALASRSGTCGKNRILLWSTAHRCPSRRCRPGCPVRNRVRTDLPRLFVLRCWSWLEKPCPMPCRSADASCRVSSVRQRSHTIVTSRSCKHDQLCLDAPGTTESLLVREATPVIPKRLPPYPFSTRSFPVVLAPRSPGQGIPRSARTLFAGRGATARVNEAGSVRFQLDPAW